MSSPNLPDGAFFTTINGRRCTAIPKEGATRTSATPERPTTNPPQRQPTPPNEVPPQRQQPDQDPPQRDPPQAEPPRQTPVNPPPLNEEDAASTARTETPPSPSSRVDVSRPTLAPIRTLLPPPQASQIQDPIIRPPLPGSVLSPTLPITPTSPLPPAVENPQSSRMRDFPPLQGTREEPARPLPTIEDASPSDVPAGSLAPSRFPSQLPVSPSISDPTAPAAETSQTDQNTAPTQDSQDPEADLISSTTTEGTGSLITTGPQIPGGAEGDQDATTAFRPGISGDPAVSGNDDGPSGLPVAAIVGGVVGGVAFLTMLALLLWFWKKNRRRRRSTLLTPLSTNDDTILGGRKERPYIFDQESVGPTPKAARFRAALGYNFQRVRGQVGGIFTAGHQRNSASVLSKDTSQYSNITGHSRHNELTSPQSIQAPGALTVKERLLGWKGRLAAVALFNEGGRSDKTLDPDPFASIREKEDETATRVAGAQPDFLTLLGMDAKAVEREAHRRRASRRQGSTASMERFLGDLGINIDNNADPFADANAIPEEPKRAAPVDPFADSNAIVGMAPPPMALKPGTNYIADVRRSRHLSVGGLTTRPPSTQGLQSPRYDSVYRASGESVESFATRRNRCRSDPFDLERPELLGGGLEGSNTSPKRPGPAHMRNGSFASKYSSGINTAGWSEPGPDVGVDTVVGGRFSPNSGWRPGAFPGREDRKRLSGGSEESRETQKTVGKAM